MSRSREKLVFVMSMAALLLGVGFGIAQESTAKKEGNNAKKTSPEIKILSKIYDTNAIEVEAGLLAQQKGRSDKVRKLGDRIARDHLSSDKMVTQLAHKKKVDLIPPQPQTAEEKQQCEKQKKVMQQLRKLDSSEFDTVFLHFMAEGHAQTIDKLKASREQLHDAEVRDFVDKLISILEQHHKLAAPQEGHE
jgi:predicted outer membrane protein